ncbi:MAG: hypothetical protein MI922_28790 [Bacteroidales bacterium]|nr:hypothetical protein [Bacteroidales bacterium]
MKTELLYHCYQTSYDARFRKAGAKFRKVVVLALLMAFTLCNAQNIDKLTSNYIKENRRQRLGAKELTELLQLPAGKVLDASLIYVADSNKKVRIPAYKLVYKVTLEAEDQKDRIAGVKILSKGLHDSDAGIVGIIAAYLKEFKLADFDAESKHQVTRLATKNVAYRKEIILLSGYLGLSDLSYNYKKELSSANPPPVKIERAMWFALARMGETEYIDKIARMVSSMPVNDDVVYDLYPMFAYTHQKQVYDHMLEEILNDDKNCLSSNPDKEVPIICAFRIIAQLGYYINNFPVEVDEYGLASDKSYDEILSIVRQWINQNKETYTIRSEVY